MRECGMLLPIASLPSKYGIGCFSKEAYEFVIVQFKKNPQYKKYKFDNANKLYFIVPETENNKDMITYYPISTIILDEILSMLCRKE